MRGKYVSPSTRLTAFNCPHCGVLTTQYWSKLFSRVISDDLKIPQVWELDREQAEELFSHIEKEAPREDMINWVLKSSQGYPFFEKTQESSSVAVCNLHISKCYDCSKLAIWLHNKLIWPSSSEAPKPNEDLPDEVRADYEEAGLVLNSSPRAAAALLRLAIQKLCKHVGGEGKKIDDDIAFLVRSGLDVRVQRALDIVRVIGNNAVHPGSIDLKDDRATAEKLFGMVNLIADAMISQPKHIDAMYESLPEGARKAIEKRDAPKMIEDKSPAK